MENVFNKKWLTALVTAVVIISSSSCTKYLNQTPENAITTYNYFKTQADAEASVIGCYDALQACVNQFLIWGEGRADLVTPTINNNTTYPWYQYMDKTLPASDWTVAYSLIGRANNVIQSVPNITKLDPKFTVQESNQLVGEALFLRSLAYFYLVRTFQNVPLVLQPPVSDDINYFPVQSSPDSVLNQIEADLITAETYVPFQYSKNTDTRGRATIGAVNALQADVYLWRAKYQQASNAAQKVLNDSATLYSLVPGSNWFSIFSQKNSSESILEVGFNYTLNETNSLSGLSNNYTINTSLIAYYNTDVDAVRGLNNTYVSGNSFWKYTGITTNNINRLTNDADFILYRLPDIMLLKAEALIHIGGFSQVDTALYLLNKVRKRASVPIYDYLNGNAPEPLVMQLIMKERAMELAMEGKRWFDLVRVANNDSNPDLLINTILSSRLVGDRATAKSRIIDPRSWYMPIYQYELNRNPKLVQNPYYQ